MSIEVSLREGRQQLGMLTSWVAEGDSWMLPGRDGDSSRSKSRSPLTKESQ